MITEVIWYEKVKQITAIQAEWKNLQQKDVNDTCIQINETGGQFKEGEFTVIKLRGPHQKIWFSKEVKEREYAYKIVALCQCVKRWTKR